MGILKILGSFLFKLLFFGLFFLISYYILYIESEKYQSESTIIIKDISQEQSVSPLGALLSSGSSEAGRDAKLLEVYIKSMDMYNLLDKEFGLNIYYTSELIDPLNRLREDTKFSFLQKTKSNFHKKYENDLNIFYDERSSTIKISFIHVDAHIAQKIVESIILHATNKLNEFEKENTKIVLKFLEKQEGEKYKLFIATLKELLLYQSKHNTIDPKVDIAAKSNIVAGLESELIQKNVEYNSKLQYLNQNSVEMNLLKGNIDFIKKNITKLKREIAGNSGKKNLSVNMSDFELLKNRVEFNKELYKQTLVKLEETKISIQQNKKNLIVVSQAGVADSYSSPNKLKDIFSVFVIISFLYGVISLILTIIRDHKD